MEIILYAFFWVITQKKAYNIQNMAKAWNQEYMEIILFKVVFNQHYQKF